MRMDSWKNPMDLTLRVTIEITDSDRFKILPLDGFGSRLIRECEESDKISDKLLALEYIARKIEEANARS